MLINPCHISKPRQFFPHTPSPQNKIKENQWILHMFVWNFVFHKSTQQAHWPFFPSHNTAIEFAQMTRDSLTSEDTSTYIIFIVNVCGWESIILVCAPFLTSRHETLTCLPFILISMTTGDLSLALWSITLIYPLISLIYKTHILAQCT